MYGMWLLLLLDYRVRGGFLYLLVFQRDLQFMWSFHFANEASSAHCLSNP